ncbi:hypothetical protein CW304_11755 [Bacillus sp. UFRGS-B20]|nr:hypothetical protein CW304_11755 [Bacillus sp. UFRGS-B20]
MRYPLYRYAAGIRAPLQNLYQKGNLSIWWQHFSLFWFRLFPCFRFFDVISFRFATTFPEERAGNSRS